MWICVCRYNIVTTTDLQISTYFPEMSAYCRKFPHFSGNFRLFLIHILPEMYISTYQVYFRLFRKFPEMSTYFRKCPVISGNFRLFPEISGYFWLFPENIYFAYSVSRKHDLCGFCEFPCQHKKKKLIPLFLVFLARILARMSFPPFCGRPFFCRPFFFCFLFPPFCCRPFFLGVLSEKTKNKKKWATDTVFHLFLLVWSLIKKKMDTNYCPTNMDLVRGFLVTEGSEVSRVHQPKNEVEMVNRSESTFTTFL